MLVMSLFASWRLAQMVGGQDGVIVLGIEVTPGAIWAGGLFVVLAGLSALLVFGFELGIAGVDEKSKAFVDLMIDTENELKKVSWPGPDELRRSTTVVLVAIVVMGAFIYVVDMVMSFAMSRVGVLPG